MLSSITRKLFFILAVMGGISNLSAATFSLDEAQLHFDIEEPLTRSGFTVFNAQGSSGVGQNLTNWSLSDTNSWAARTTTNNSWTYASLPHLNTDRFHLGGNFTLSFDRVVNSIVFFMQDNPDGSYQDGFDFGLAPSSSMGLELSGTRIYTDADGGWVLFENLNLTSLTNMPTGDGSDISWYVLESSQISPVPLPAAAWLFGTALVGFIGLRRKKQIPA